MYQSEFIDRVGTHQHYTGDGIGNADGIEKFFFVLSTKSPIIDQKYIYYNLHAQFPIL